MHCTPVSITKEIIMVYRLRLKTILLYVAGLFVLYLIGTLLFFNATPKEIRVKQAVETGYTVRSTQFMIDSGQISGRQWTQGNHIDILTRGSETFRSMYNDIGSAEKSITKETYNYYGDEVGRPMAEALAEAADRGVKTFFLMDYIGSAMASSEYFEIMKEAGVRVERWREPSWYQIARFNHRTHRKLLIVDGSAAYTGGVNTADPWLPDPQEGGHKDYHFRITGPAVQELQGAFLENWISARGELLTGYEFFRLPDTPGDLPVKITTSHPREGQKRVRTMMLHAIASAGESIRIGVAYFFPDKDFIKALTSAAERGVKIQLILPGEEIDKRFVRLASQSLWGPLLEAGVEIYEYQPVLYHPKFMIIDDFYVTSGSTNFDNRSFRLNDETNFSVLSESFAAQMVEHFEQDLRDSELITYNRWRERPWWNKIRGWITAKLIGPYL
jgi:cardiolipin synthase